MLVSGYSHEEPLDVPVCMEGDYSPKKVQKYLFKSKSTSTSPRYPHKSKCTSTRVFSTSLSYLHKPKCYLYKSKSYLYNYKCYLHKSSVTSTSPSVTSTSPSVPRKVQVTSTNPSHPLQAQVHHYKSKCHILLLIYPLD